MIKTYKNKQKIHVQLLEKLVPKICDSVIKRQEKKYNSYIGDVVETLQKTVKEQATIIESNNK